jgi:hypothetical protein
VAFRRYVADPRGILATPLLPILSERNHPLPAARNREVKFVNSLEIIDRRMC